MFRDIETLDPWVQIFAKEVQGKRALLPARVLQSVDPVLRGALKRRRAPSVHWPPAQVGERFFSLSNERSGAMV